VWENRTYNATELNFGYAYQRLGHAAGRLAALRALGCARLVEAALAAFAAFDHVLFLEDARTMPAIAAFAANHSARISAPSADEQLVQPSRKGKSRPGPAALWKVDTVVRLTQELNSCSLATYAALRAKYGWYSAAKGETERSAV